MEVLVSNHIPESGEFQVVRELTNYETGESQLNLFVFPEDTLEWRAAEYQIDPSETDLLMDIVLYESLMQRDPAERFPVLLTAKTIADARAIHIDRVMATKEKHRPQGPNQWKTNPQRLERLRAANPQLVADWAGLLRPDALQSIRDNHVMEPEVLTEKFLNVEHQRKQIREKILGFVPRSSRSASTEERVARLRSLRALREGNPNEQQ